MHEWSFYYLKRGWLLRDSLKISTIFLTIFFSLLFTYCSLFIYRHWDLMFRNFCIIVFLIEEIFWKEKKKLFYQFIIASDDIDRILPTKLEV